MAEQIGCVYLVGAGPGDPGLCTLRGAEVLGRAQVVVYDRLVSPALLDLAPPESQRMYVGKEGFGPSIPQSETTSKLVELGRAGLRVVRLKGGDPYVFGRGGEEALALAEAGVPFEVVPGISSSIAAPAYAGIPVTHRGLSASFTVATGHEDPTKGEPTLDWPALARGSQTLVFVMGVEHLSEIAERLLAGGRPADEPAALVRWGTTPDQERLVSTLGNIVADAQAAGIRPPSVLVIGKVVTLAERLDWFGRRPLRGRRVLVTRAREQASELSARLAELGARPLEFPTIRIAPLQETAELDAAVRRLRASDWVIFTSANGASAAFERLAAAGLDARAFGTARVAAIGPATERALAARGIRADFVPTAFSAADIVEQLGPQLVPGARVLLLRADIAPPALAEGLAASGATVENVVAYRTLPDLAARDEIRELLRTGRVDAVTFTSSSTVRNLVEALDGETSLLGRCLVASIGPVTSGTARELGLRVDVEAESYTIDGLVAALTARFAPATPETGGRP